MIVTQSYAAGPGWLLWGKAGKGDWFETSKKIKSKKHYFKPRTTVDKNLKKVADAFRLDKSEEEKNKAILNFWWDYTQMNVYRNYCEYQTPSNKKSKGGARKAMFANFVINWKQFENIRSIEYFSRFEGKYADWFFNHGNEYKKTKLYKSLKQFLDPRNAPIFKQRNKK